MSRGPGAWWGNRQGRRAGLVRMRSRLWKFEGLEFRDLESLIWNRGTFCTRLNPFSRVYKPSCLFLIWSQRFWSLTIKIWTHLHLLALIHPSIQPWCSWTLVLVSCWWVQIQLHRSLLHFFLGLETHLQPCLMETSKVCLTFDPTLPRSLKPDRFVWLASLTLRKVRTTQRKRNLTIQI